MLAIAVSYENRCTCSCDIPDDTPCDARAVLEAVCSEKKLSPEDWSEVLVVQGGLVRQYTEEDWTEFEEG